jgi:hypothetical protein
MGKSTVAEGERVRGVRSRACRTRRLNAITQPLKERPGPSFDDYESPENDRTR